MFLRHNNVSHSIGRICSGDVFIATYLKHFISTDINLVTV